MFHQVRVKNIDKLSPKHSKTDLFLIVERNTKDRSVSQPSGINSSAARPSRHSNLLKLDSLHGHRPLIFRMLVVLGASQKAWRYFTGLYWLLFNLLNIRMSSNQPVFCCFRLKLRTRVEDSGARRSHEHIDVPALPP